MTRTEDAGFTLTEMLVVLAIVGLGAGIAATGLRPKTDAQMVTEAAKQVRHRLSLARMQALRTGSETTVTIDPKARRIEGPRGTTTLDASLSIEVRTGRELVGSDGSNGGTRRAAILFLPGGGSSGGHVAVTRNGTSLTVAVHWLTGVRTITP